MMVKLIYIKLLWFCTFSVLIIYFPNNCLKRGLCQKFLQVCVAVLTLIVL